MAKRGKQPYEECVVASAARPARGEVFWRKQVGCRDHRHAHRAVLVSPLRPGKIFFNPNGEAHTPVELCSAYRGSHFDSWQNQYTPGSVGDWNPFDDLPGLQVDHGDVVG